ncbi:MAG: ATP phosphoribosyltransferase regulatory subunit [Sandaracinaceae bacterium]|nr:ATP phosphoribosyltransferase regulatory subunit [Sandaracinaceae bacterium]
MRTSSTLGSSLGRVLAPPVGTRDLLPPEAAARRRLVRQVAEVLELRGYSLVITPPFELVETVERGLGGDPRETLRFVDPETGEVSVFRPDLTVQVARLVATSLRDRPPPHRLYYEGHVLRARRGRARRQRQIAQIGAECIGIGGAVGDAEIIETASRALEEVGLDHRVELAVVPLVRALSSELAPDVRARVTEALGRKDRKAVETALADAHAPRPIARGLADLEGLTGGAEVIARARAVLGPLAARHLDDLEALLDALSARGLSQRIQIDLGEVRGFEYYTGPSFSLLAEGPGEPLGGGGRYDDLLERFGAPMPASGFAIDLDHLARAHERQHPEASFAERPRVCVRGENAASILDALRAHSVPAAWFPGTRDEAIAYAREWGLDAVIERVGDRATILWQERAEACSVGEIPERVRARKAAPHAEDGR